MDAVGIQRPLEGLSDPGTCATSLSSPIPHHTVMTTDTSTHPTLLATQGGSGEQLITLGKALTLCGILSIMILMTTFCLIILFCFVSHRRQARQVLVQRSTETVAVAIRDVQHLAGGKAIARTAIVRFSRTDDELKAVTTGAHTITKHVKDITELGDIIAKFADDVKATAETAKANADAAAADGAIADEVVTAEDLAGVVANLVSHIRVIVDAVAREVEAAKTPADAAKDATKAAEKAYFAAQIPGQAEMIAFLP